MLRASEVSLEASVAALLLRSWVLRAPEVSLGASAPASLPDDEAGKQGAIERDGYGTDEEKRKEKRRCTPQREGTRIASARPGVGRALQG